MVFASPSHRQIWYRKLCLTTDLLNNTFDASTSTATADPSKFVLHSGACVVHHSCVVVYPLPWPLLVGESDVPACGPPASFSVHLASSAVTPAGSVHKSRGDNVVRMWVQLKR